MTAEKQRLDPALHEIVAGTAVLRDGTAAMRACLLTRGRTLTRLRGELAALRSIVTIPRKMEPALPETSIPRTPGLADRILAKPASTAPGSSADKPFAEDCFQEEAAPQTSSIFEPPVFEPLLEEPASAATVAVKPRVLEELPSVLKELELAAPAAEARRSPLRTAVPVLCLVGIFFAIARFHAPTSAARPQEDAAAPAPAPAAVDEPSAEALALVRQWRLAGDDKPLFERLGGVVEHPGGVPAWRVETVADGAYLVIFREAAGTPVYAFEADLKSKTVLPTPEATDRLTLMRVRDEAAAQLIASRRP